MFPALRFRLSSFSVRCSLSLDQHCIDSDVSGDHMFFWKLASVAVGTEMRMEMGTEIRTEMRTELRMHNTHNIEGKKIRE